MLRKLSVPIAICTSLTSGCMSTPPLSQASGSEHTEIMIKDVVVRIKCELSDAFDNKVEQPEYRWLATWTAHADLALAINDNAGISPNGSYTRFQGNAVNTAAGPSSFTNAALSTSRFVTQQFLTVSAGANFSGQAVRTETVSFTIALDELKIWRQQLDRAEANLPLDKRICNFGSAKGVTGNLGLKEWVDSAFYPVGAANPVNPAGKGQLEAGTHDADWKPIKLPNANISGGALNYNSFLQSLLAKSRITPERAAGGPAPASIRSLGAEAELTEAEKKAKRKQIRDQVFQWQSELKNLQTATKDSMSAITSANEKIFTNGLSLNTKLLGNKKYRSVMTPQLMEKYNQAIAKMKGAVSATNECVKYKQAIDLAYQLSYAIIPSVNLSTDGKSYSCPDPAPRPLPAPKPAKTTCDITGKASCDAEGKTMCDITGKASCEAAAAPPPPSAPLLLPLCPAINDAADTRYDKLSKTMAKIETGDYERHAVDCANGLTLFADIVSTYVNAIPNQVDPPVDSVLHSLQFVVSYGANVTPSWSLLQWKGPGQTGNLLSASGIRTHNLNLALGPRSGAAPISQDATRLIQNQTVRSVGN